MRRSPNRRRTKVVALAAAVVALALSTTAAATLPIGDQFRVSTTGADGVATFDGVSPGIAYNPVADRYLLVWQGENAVPNEDEVFGRLYAADGTPVGGQFRISDMGAADGDATYFARNPAVDVNRRTGEFLVVWEGRDDTPPNDPTEREIFGQRLDAAGNQVGTNDFRISDMGPGGGTNNAFDPDVVYNQPSNEFLVVWDGNDGAPLANFEFEIYGQRLDASGAEIGTNDFRISDMGTDGSTASGLFAPAAAHNGEANEYLVVWDGDDGAPLADDEFEVYGQRLDASGAEIGTNDVRISDMGTDGSAAAIAEGPDVTFNGRSGEYLVVWGGDDGAPLADGEFEIFGQRLDGSGAEIGVNDFRISDMGPDDDAAFVAIFPNVVADFRANEYLVTWYGDDDTAPLVDDELEIFGQRLDAAGNAVGTNDVRVSTSGPDSVATYGAFSPAAAYGGARNEYLIAWDADDDMGALADNEYEVYARRFGAGAVPAPPAAACRSVTPTVAPPGDPSKVTLSRTQLLINQRISQAAVNRANAIQKWLEAGVRQQDVCGGALTQADMGSGVTAGFLPDATLPATASPRPVTPDPIGGGDASKVTLTTGQLLINQRVSQAAVRRANALKARLDAGLTGGDVLDLALSRDSLQFGLGLLVATPIPNPPAKTTTNVAPPTRGDPSAVKLTRTQLLINQRISQAAVKRTNTLRDRLAAGLTATDIRDASVTAIDFAASVRP